VIATQASPFSMKWSCETPHENEKSYPRPTLPISTMTLPLKRAGSAGRRSMMRVVYGAFGVFTRTLPSPAQSYTLAVPLTKNSSST
jgi:hypothetical protein